MNGLMSERIVGYDDVCNAPVPAITRSYCPVANKQFLGMIAKTAIGHDLQLENPQFGLSNKDQRMFGTYEIVNHDHFGNQVRLMLGFRNSYDKSLTAGVCFGTKVFVCSNLVFTAYAGDENIIGHVQHKHTVNVNRVFLQRLQAALGQFEKFKEFHNRFYNHLSKTEINEDKAYATIVRAVRSDIIPNSDVARVAQIWDWQGREPLDNEVSDNWHKEFQDRNAWSLLNCFTENHKRIQETSPVLANKRSINLTNMFHSEFRN